jgi:ABC-type transport system substrate-binding protein
MLNTGGFSRKFIFGWLALCCLAAFFEIHWSGTRTALEAPRPRAGGVLKIKAYGGSLNSDLDPAGNGYPTVIEHLYEGLVRLDHNLGILPGLADYWTISEGGKKVTFYLRKEAVFHNGQDVRAEDVKFSYERLFQLKRNPLFYLFATRVEGGEEFWQGEASEVSGFRVLDSKTFEIDWKFPSTANFYFLASGFAKILPKNLVLSQKKRFFDKPVGAGPFKFDYWLRNSRLDIIGIRLERNDRYFSRKPYLQAIEISPYFILDDFFKDELQIVPYISYRISRNKYQIIESNTLHLVYLFFSCHLPPFDRPEVRQALKTFIEKDKLAGMASSPAYFAQVMNNYIPPYVPGFLPEDVSEIPSLGRAIETLSSHGLGNSEKPIIVYLYIEFPQKEIIQNLYRELRQELSPAGIKLELKLVKSLEEVRTETVPYLIYFDWLMNFPDPEFLIYPLFHSKSFLNYNYFHYRNEQVDELFEAQQSCPGFDRRVALFKQIEDHLRAEAPAIPLHFYKQRQAYQPYIKNLKSQPPGFFYINLRDAWVDR